MPTPAIIITISGSTTYQQLIQSLGSYVYIVDGIYLKSTVNNQISQPIFFNEYDSNGNAKQESIIPAIDPFQRQQSLYLDVSNSNVIIDGRENFNFLMQPNAGLQFKLYCRRIALIDMLPGDSNFISVVDYLGQNYFFNNYTEKVVKNKFVIENN